MGVLATFFRWFSENFLCSHLIGQKNCIFQPSRRRIYNLFTKFNSPPTYKDKNSAKYPLVKNIPHLYPWDRGFEYPFSKMFIVYLHPRAGWKCPHLIATEKRKVHPLEQFSKGQFCKNTVYLERGMPYSCFFVLMRIYGFLPSFWSVQFRREDRSDQLR